MSQALPSYDDEALGLVKNDLLQRMRHPLMQILAILMSCKDLAIGVST
jgi:hypothetical protein